MTRNILCAKMTSVYKHIFQSNEHLQDKFELEIVQSESGKLAGSIWFAGLNRRAAVRMTKAT